MNQLKDFIEIGCALENIEIGSKLAMNPKTGHVIKLRFDVLQESQDKRSAISVTSNPNPHKILRSNGEEL